ncbi:gramicidin S synthase 2 isoform X2 [Daktulosphaira vitifoliae]|uniref:gramicidin S synthase 2 isoform X2 n=1 Tax=Daktulosphaira vitifoliae TaxID=58002 RepID=UPI0021AAE719|nr:gramicidin S synthase 2 isoform X2 [Daktulosphaira vitifoliae]
MEIYPVTSVLQGPSVPVNKKIKLHRLFEKNEKNYEDHLAVIYEEMGQPSVRLSCSELNAIANQLARGIVARAGAANSDADFVVAVQLPPSDGLLAVLLAIWKSGGTYLPVDPTAPEHRISHVLDEAKPCLVITHSPDEVFEKISDNVFSLKQLKKFSATFSASNLEDEETLNGDRSEKTAIIIYTSGSTGTPKGVRLPHYVIYNRLNWQWNRFPFSETEKACVFKTSLTFVDAVAEIWAPLLHDSPRCLIVVPKSVTKDPERLINILNQHKIERLVLVPSLLHAILLYLGISNNNNQFSSMENQNNEQGILSRLKLWICSGEPLPVSLAKQFLDTFSGHTLCNFYGSTEIMADATYYAINSYKDLCYGDKIPIGVPIDNTELYLLDSQGQIVTPGSLGELFVAGANLASGYVNNRDPHRFIKNKFSQNKGMDKMYQTGDFGKIVNGVLLYEGRTDSQIKVRGHRVDLMEVESAIHKLPNSDIDKLAVLCYKPGETEQALLAFVVFNKDKNVPSTMQIEEKLRHALPDYALPQVISLDTMPYLINGKIDRQSLLRMYSNMSSTNKVNKLIIDYSGVSSTKMSTAKSLFETLSDVLGNSLRSHITSNANFFALGGNSLNAIYTISKLADLGYSINVSDFIIAPDLGTIVKKMVFTGKPELSCCSEDWLQEKYLVQILEPKHKNDVIRIIADSFYEKADLEHWLEPAVPYSDYTDILEMIWEPLVEKKLSFAVYSKESNQMVGASLNFDMLDEPDIDFNGRLLLIFEFLEFLEGPLRDNRLPKGKGRIIHSFMMGTDKLLDAATNVEIITFMEQENLKIGKAREFDGIFTTNTNPLTQQLGTNVFGYKTLLDYQVNKYVTSDGIQLFRKAPDTQRAICCWKLII